MISDEPDEDADAADDGALLECLLDTPHAVTAHVTAHLLHDWPPRGPSRDNLAVDADILAWFKANHQDWQRQIQCVLRAWIATQPNTLSRS